MSATVKELNEELKSLREENQLLKASAPTLPVAEPQPLDVLMGKYENTKRNKVLQKLNLRALTSTEVSKAIASIQLSSAKKAKLQELTLLLTTALVHKPYGKKAIKDMLLKIQDLLVEWGLSASLVGQSDDYKTMAQLLACATVAAE